MPNDSESRPASAVWPGHPRLTASWVGVTRCDGTWTAGSGARAITLFVGCFLLFGIVVHECGHWILGRRAGLTPSQMRLHSPLAPARNPETPEVALRSCGWPRLIAVACTATSGSVWYAGSTDEAAGCFYPPSPDGGATFDKDAPGGTERVASLGGPLFQGVYGMALLVMAGLAVAHWGLRLSVLACGIAGALNVYVALDSMRRFEKGKSRSDGWYVRRPSVPAP